MNEEQLNDALKNYLDGTDSPEKQELIDQWYAKYEKAVDYTDGLQTSEKEALRQKMLAQVLEHAKKQDTGIQPAPVVKAIFTRHWWKYCAAAIVIIIAGVALWTNRIKPEQQVYYVENNTARIVQQVLPDSSVVWLEPHSSLHYPAAFGNKVREVTMNGDCFFEVKKNAQKPFIIYSNRLVTKVWGTSFRVLDVQNQPEARVTVVTGKVSVGRKEGEAKRATAAITAKEVLLLPRQEVVFNTARQAMETRTQADMSPLKKWEHAALNFTDASLPDITATLSAAFGTDVRLADSSLNSVRMTADLSGLNLPEVLEALKTSLNINYHINDKYIIVSY